MLRAETRMAPTTTEETKVPALPIQLKRMERKNQGLKLNYIMLKFIVPSNPHMEAKLNLVLVKIGVADNATMGVDENAPAACQRKLGCRDDESLPMGPGGINEQMIYK